MSRHRSGPPGDPAAVVHQERRLLTELCAGAAGSVVAGVALWVAGRRSARSTVTAFGRQTAAWGLVDAAIAAWGWRGTMRSPSAEATPSERARRLRTVTAVNAVADVGYVIGGVALTRRTRRRGDGAAIVLQGLFLLWLDVKHARRFHRLVAPASPRT